MMAFFYRRRKELFLTAAAAAAAGALAYYLWPWGDDREENQDEPMSQGQARILELVKEPAIRIDAYKSPTESVSRKDDQSLDQTMDSHFSFIQDVSTPQELDQLLPRLHSALTQLTDIKSAMSQHGSTSYTPEGAAAQLHALARLCFGRALGACWLIPCMDLVVRVKLNIIGRHLFLQEKLLKLKHTGGTAHTQNGLLPPRLTASAIEKFLECGWPTSQGGHEWIVSKVMSGIDRVLEGLSLEVEVAPADLFKVMASMLKEAETRMSQHMHFGGFSFPTQSHSELEQSKAIDDSDGGSLKTAHGGSASSEGSYFSTSTNDKDNVPANGLSNHSVPSSSVSLQPAAGRAAGVAIPPVEAAGRAAGMAIPPAQQDTSVAWADVLVGPRPVHEDSNYGASAQQPTAWLRQGGEEQQYRTACSASMVQELHAELCSVLSTPRFTEAMRAAVQHTFRLVATHIYTEFPPAPPVSGSSSPQTAGSAAGAPPLASSSPFSAASTEGVEQGGCVRNDSCVFGAVPTGGAAATGSRGSRAPRQLARLLKAIQASGDAAFQNVNQVTKGISELSQVLALSATAFAVTSHLDS